MEFLGDGTKEYKVIYHPFNKYCWQEKQRSEMVYRIPTEEQQIKGFFPLVNPFFCKSQFVIFIYNKYLVTIFITNKKLN